ncbi:hypothetical protein EDD86DRAFT_246515 [Gorgonomyces haynaldii]|nr:hypothetical protein EDD86DRAFT_246515 [Gorgonomyces haynaldii]
MHSKAASFGRGSETVYDPSIRKALEIQSQDCQFVFSDKMQQVQVQLNRLASEGYQLIPKFYKIHVYEQGGHFDMHRDALHAENHFGTLVVGLSEIGFTGGEFVLLVNGKEMRIDTNRESVCFLTDLEHRVDQVTSGCRVTFQFDLYLEDISEMEDEEDDCWELDDSASNGRDAVWKYKPDYVPKLQVEKLPETPSSENLLEIHKQLVIQLKDYLALNPSKSVSILLLHRYPREMSVDLLKASDKDLYLLLKQHFRLNLGFCVHNIYDFHSQPDPYHDHYRVINFELAERLKAYLDTGDFEQHAPNETHLFVGYGATFNKQHLSKYVEFTGNESQADVYAYQAFTLNVK